MERTEFSVVCAKCEKRFDRPLGYDDTVPTRAIARMSGWTREERMQFDNGYMLYVDLCPSCAELYEGGFFRSP